jgi:hypothetical protein
VRRMVLTTRMLITTPSTHNPRTFFRSTRLYPQSPHTSPSLLVSATSMVSTNQVTSSSNLDSSASIKHMLRLLLEQRRTSLFSWSSTVDLVLPRPSSRKLSHTVLSRSTSILIFNTLTSLVFVTMFSTKRTIS